MSKWKDWVIEKIVSKGDYDYAVVKDHPNATKNGYVLYHRIIMENKLKRLLRDDEDVHHKNKNGKCNRKNNLIVLSVEEHQKLHAKEKSKYFVKLTCPNCDKNFERAYSQTFLSKPKYKLKATCCSPSCRGSFSREVQLNGMTKQISQKIKNNVMSIYIKQGSVSVRSSKPQQL